MYDQLLNENYIISKEDTSKIIVLFKIFYDAEIKFDNDKAKNKIFITFDGDISFDQLHNDFFDENIEPFFEEDLKLLYSHYLI